jgi:predicted porin
MNNTIKLAVAAALLVGASSASAGIMIPAGDWTLDINGNVNAYYIHNSSSDSNTILGGLTNNEGANGSSTASINTGLLPSWLGVTGRTRQNDLDVEFAISFQPGASSKTSLAGGGGTENRQAYISFGDKSWGTILIGKNLGEFGRDAILLDQTLLGVGSQGVVGTAGGTTTTLGRIGTGFLYADFQGQINYTSPNWNGFSFVAGIVQPINTFNLSSTSGTSSGAQSQPAFEAKASYSWAGDVAGKVWGEVKSQKVEGIGSSAASETARAFGIGANVNVAGFGLVGYYYNADGAGTTAWLMDGFAANGKSRDSDGGYVQAMYTIPGAGTKVAASWGISNLDKASGETATTLVKENEMWTVGAYHPLTKHLNLVAEYSQVTSKNHSGAENESDIASVGAILFF